MIQRAAGRLKYIQSCDSNSTSPATSIQDFDLRIEFMFVPNAVVKMIAAKGYRALATVSRMSGGIRTVYDYSHCFGLSFPLVCSPRFGVNTLNSVS